MGAFNRLRAEARCPNCGQTMKQVIQFKFGDTWQYDYDLGDTLRWVQSGSVQAYGTVGFGGLVVAAVLMLVLVER